MYNKVLNKRICFTAEDMNGDVLFWCRTAESADVLMFKASDYSWEFDLKSKCLQVFKNLISFLLFFSSI